MMQLIRAARRHETQSGRSTRTLGARRQTRAHGRRRGGMATLEFAMVLPMLLLFTLGLVQYAIIVFGITQAKNLTRESARYASIHAAADYEKDATDPYKSTLDDTMTRAALISVPIKRSDIVIKAYDAQERSEVTDPDTGKKTPVRPAGGNTIQVVITANLRPKIFFPVNPSYFGVSFFSTDYVASSLMVVEGSSAG